MVDPGKLERVGVEVLRWGTVMILVWIGAYKFAPSEAAAIRPLVENSPFMGWMYGVLSENAVSALIGTSELAVAAAIATRPWLPGVSFFGSLAAVGIFTVTLSFLATTPGMFAVPSDFPFAVPAGGGGFVLKDLFILGGSLVAAAEARRAATARG